VYSDNAGTGDFSRAVRQSQLQQLPVGGRRRSSANRFPRHSLAAEVIPEEVATPSAPEPKESDVAAAVAAPTPARLEMTEDMAISPDCTPAARHGQQQPHSSEMQETPADAGCAMGDVDGLTTNLLLDDRNAEDSCWGHVPPARASSGTGRGSVGSNVPTLHGLVSFSCKTAIPAAISPLLYWFCAAAVMSTCCLSIAITASLSEVIT